MASKPASRFVFTHGKLTKLKPPAKGRERHYDARQSGLTLRVTAAGAKTFYLYYWNNEKPVQLRIGDFGEIGVDQARDACRRMMGDMAAGVDVAASRRARRRKLTLQHAYDHWIAHAKLRKREKSWREDARMFKTYLQKYAGLRLERIGKGMVQEWHDAIGKENGAYQANRVRSLLSSLFNAAEDLGHSGGNPVARVRKFAEASRERFLLPDEAAAFLEAVNEEEAYWRDYFLLCLFIGTRRGNVGSMRWEELDLGNGLWYLPGEKMKNGQPFVAVLPKPAVTILESRLADRNGSEWVFPAKRSKTGHLEDPYPAWRRILKRSGISDLRIHDLRRTLGSWQAGAGASLAVIGKSLGHAHQATTQIYARLQIDPVRASVETAVAAIEAAGKKVEESPKLLEGPK